MKWTFYVEYIASVLWLLLGVQPAGSRWSRLAVLVVQATLLGLVFRKWLGPFALRRTYTRMRIRSISPRSIRGVYVHMGSMMWSIDRIGLSYHRPSNESARRFSVKVEGMLLEVQRRLPEPSAFPQNVPVRRRRRPTLADFAPSPMARRVWRLYSTIYAAVDPFMRPFIRAFFVASIRLVIRCLPTLTQVFDFEVDKVVVSFSDIPGVHVTVGGATVYSRITFTNPEGLVRLPKTQVKKETVQYGFMSMAHLKSRFASSVMRVWGRAWGHTQGSASITISLRNFNGIVDISQTTEAEARNSYLATIMDQDGIPHVRGASRYDYLSRRGMSVIMGSPGSTELTSSCQFGPKKGIIEEHSLTASLVVTDLQVNLDPLLPLLRMRRRNFAHREFTRDDCSCNLDVGTDVSQTSQGYAVRDKLKASTFFSRWNWSSNRQGQDATDTMLPKVFRACKVNIVKAAINFGEDRHDDPHRQSSVARYTSQMRGFELAIGTSGPENELHRDYLGRSTMQRDSSAYLLCVNAAEAHTLMDNRGAPPTRILSLGSVDVQVLLSQWPEFLLSATSQVPNDALCAARLVVSSITFTEDLSIFRDILRDLRGPAAGDPSTPIPHFWNGLPRLYASLHVLGMTFCCFPEVDTQPRGTMVLRTSGTHAVYSSEYQHLPTALVADGLRSVDAMPTEMALSMQFSVDPVFLTFLHREYDLDRMPFDSLPSAAYGDPLLSISSIDAFLHGRIRGESVTNSTGVDFNIASTFLEGSCALDVVSMELWQPDATAALLALLRRSRVSTPQPTTQRNQVVGVAWRLPCTVTMHLGIGRCTIMIASVDPCSSDSSGLSRGCAARSGFSFEFCSLHNRGPVSRIPGRLRRGYVHQWLGLPDDLLTNAASLLNVQGPTEEGTAISRIRTWDTTFRTCVATKYAADYTSDLAEEDEALKACEFLWLDRLSVVAIFQRVRAEQVGHSGRTQVTLTVPYVRARLETQHLYAIMLTQPVLKLLTRPTDASAPRAHASPPIATTIMVFKATIDTCQVLWTFPLQDQVCLRLNGIALRRSEESKLSLALDGLFMWVPSPHSDGKWEECIRLRSWTVLYDIAQDDVALTVAGKAARFSVPHDYIVADLVMDISVMYKAIRHLMRVIDTGTFRPLEHPEPEGAKPLPSVRIALEYLTVEAADDPLESQLSLIWRAGQDAARTREERDEAFEAKVAAILAAETGHHTATSGLPGERRFTPEHSVSINDARERLYQVHSISWLAVHKQYSDQQVRQEENIRRRVRGDFSSLRGFEIPPPIAIRPLPKTPPLIRIAINALALELSSLRYSPDELADYLYDIGNGVPHTTKYTLLVPMHIRLSLDKTDVILRDYPIPFLHVPSFSSEDETALSLDTDLIVAEEMGTRDTVVWKDCLIVPADARHLGSNALSLSVPRTTMPIKSYAAPVLNIYTTQLVHFCWGVGYNPALQDVLRVIDTLSTAPMDPSPGIGFWDKIRLILHWRIRLSFAGKVQLNLKGSRDPYRVDGDGAGFAFCWDGNTHMHIGHKNSDREILQVMSDTMLVVIPNFNNSTEADTTDSSAYKKVCAKFAMGIKWGIGVNLERTCEAGCKTCVGSFKCRFFTFKPHYEVALTPKLVTPREKTAEDSYSGFRSDFIHMSTSLSTATTLQDIPILSRSNIFHLTPKTFAHFWSWWELFDRLLSLPIRQGPLFPTTRPQSRKLGRHLATLKYRIAVSNLYISHVYIDDTKESWADGVVNCIGVKALVERFEADMHQREQEGLVPGPVPFSTKRIRHKPFYAAEAKLFGLQVNSMIAVFPEPLKKFVGLDPDVRESIYHKMDSAWQHELKSPWVDTDDFVELDWRPSKESPNVYLLPFASCPRFTYSRRHCRPPDGQRDTRETSRFGSEDSHVCLMGREPSVQQVQTEMVTVRIAQLKKDMAALMTKNPKAANNQKCNSDTAAGIESIRRKLLLLENYVLQQMKFAASPPTNVTKEDIDYRLLAESCKPEDWSDFINVYHFHCPKVSIGNAIRDILMQYYYCSRSRRGFEYHMATRAVRFIRDQANAILSRLPDEKDKRNWKPAQALRKILIGDEASRPTVRLSENVNDASEDFDPMSGWSEGVAIQRSHFFLLLKPQIVLRSETSNDAVCVLAAIQAVLQSFAVLDTANVEDPVIGRVMTRNHAVLSGLQTFLPSTESALQTDGIPFETLIDLMAEGDEYERLMPQTDATFLYDKFNRLRLRNNILSNSSSSVDGTNGHLQNQMDLINIVVPRFTVTAGSRGFQAISNVITDLILHSDSAHRMHLNEVERLWFRYDFTDLASAARVVESLQARLRRAVELERDTEGALVQLNEPERLDVLRVKAQIFNLAEELSLIFDAIKLAQDKVDDKQADLKSALKLHAYSSEISWGMTDDNRDLIAKLAVRGIDFTWLSRQDSSTVNRLEIVDLQAFDGSPDAEWPEILSRFRESSNHPLVKKGLFAQADWTILAPVGGIVIYESFILDLHPIRLQLEAGVGRKIMEYVFPARRDRRQSAGAYVRAVDEDNGNGNEDHTQGVQITVSDALDRRTSVDSPRVHHRTRFSMDVPPSPNSASRHLGASRSFTDLRQARRQSAKLNIQRTSSTESLKIGISSRKTQANSAGAAPQGGVSALDIKTLRDDAAEMRTRASQKTFVLVRISSLHLLLSIRKDGSFFCRDARIRTRELEYRNETWSFEELAEQFIPSDMSWKGWVKVALHQPLIPIWPVAKELISKTKWVAAKGIVRKEGRVGVGVEQTFDASNSTGRGKKTGKLLTKAKKSLSKNSTPSSSRGDIRTTDGC